MRTPIAIFAHFVILLTFATGVAAQGSVTDGRYHSARGWFSVPVPKASNFARVPFAVQSTSIDSVDVGSFDLVTFWVKDFGEVLIASVRHIPDSVLAKMREEDNRTVLSNLAFKAVHDWRYGIPNSLPVEPKIIEDTFVSTPHGEAILRVYVAERGSLLARASGRQPGAADTFDTEIAVIVARQKDHYVYAIAENDAASDAAFPPGHPLRGKHRNILPLKRAVESFFSSMLVHR